MFLPSFNNVVVWVTLPSLCACPPGTSYCCCSLPTCKRTLSGLHRVCRRWLTDVTPLAGLISSDKCRFTAQTAPWALPWKPSLRLRYSQPNPPSRPGLDFCCFHCSKHKFTPRGCLKLRYSLPAPAPRPGSPLSFLHYQCLKIHPIGPPLELLPAPETIPNTIPIKILLMTCLPCLLQGTACFLRRPFLEARPLTLITTTTDQRSLCSPRTARSRSCCMQSSQVGTLPPPLPPTFLWTACILLAAFSLIASQEY